MWSFLSDSVQLRLVHALLFAGGISNLADRVAHGGHVVDFMNIGVGHYRTGVFSVADVAIMGGTVLLLAAELLRDKPGPSAP